MTHLRDRARRALPVLFLAVLAGCTDPGTVVVTSAAPATTPASGAAVSTTTGPPEVAHTRAPPPTPVATTTTNPPPAPVTHVTVPGSYTNDHLVIHIAFRSEVPETSSTELEDIALAILNDPSGWSRSGFTFVADESSELHVVLADGPRVDELCLPLETFGIVSCQNGSIVALNVDRWDGAWRGWDAGVDAYRVYLVTHEVGHLIGLLHPDRECPQGEPRSAVMDPQTKSELPCPGNGVPLPWEIEWAAARPAVVGPSPEWNGPRPTWGRGPDSSRVGH